jgi:hypothetical protein
MSSKIYFYKKLKINSSIYYKNKLEYQMNISYMNFHNKEKITAIGSNKQGNFILSGRCEGEFIFLKKEQKGKIDIFYVGLLEENKLYLYYDKVDNKTKQISKLNKREYNAFIEFDLTELNNFCNGAQKEIWKSFFKNVENNLPAGPEKKCEKINGGDF